MSKLADPTNPGIRLALLAGGFLLVVAGLFFLVLKLLTSGQVATLNQRISGSALPVQTLPVAPTTTILVAGDIMISRNVAAKIETSRNPDLPFKQIIPLASGADIAFANLECPLSASTVPLGEGLVFRCLTRDAAGLQDAGFDVLGTANNHAFDQGRAGLDFTTQHLSSLGILAAGTGADFAQAHAAQILRRNGVSFGFLSYSYSARNDGGKTADPQIATTNNLDQLKQDILAAKAAADIVVVNMHAGIEYTREPTKDQEEFARAAIGAGADIVIGEHPHWIQPLEIYQGKPIFYSLGNFIFDQSWSVDTTEGLAVRFAFQGKTLRQAEMIPIKIENNCCARLADPREAQTILQKIHATSTVIRF